ncbi:conserved hypothetical protein [Ricinus communis]|uniref:Uncharacterized protein n=1 Tax=Ricinus communis TaxID=3988 RepID=B9SL95_RICCO|nr:conserved hypothetical protein [Ricinus communis]
MEPKPNSSIPFMPSKLSDNYMTAPLHIKLRGGTFPVFECKNSMASRVVGKKEEEDRITHQPPNKWKP